MNKIAFILSGFFFLNTQGSESLKYLFASKEKVTTFFIYSFKFCLLIKSIKEGILFLTFFINFKSFSLRLFPLGILLLQFFLMKEKTL